MDLSKAILGKDIYELDISDIVNFFSNEQEETSVLEFKSGDASLERIHREVSAFLNTEGGILIFGSPIEQKRGSAKVCKGNLVPCKSISDQDTLLRSIASNIAPSPMNIKAKSFYYDGGMVFVLEISQSVTPPHQVSNEGKYYIRLERDAKAAPHGIVEALFNRRQRPQLTGEIGFLETDVKGDIRIDFRVTNDSMTTAERIGVMLSVYGVRKKKKVINLQRDITLRDDKLVVQEQLDNNLLVKGLSVEFSTVVELQYNFALVSFAFYCKDGDLQTKLRLFTIQPFSIVKRYDTTKDPESDSKLIFDEYRNMQSNSLREILTANRNNCLSEQASLQDIFDLFNFLGLELPDSYVAFLEISNGFSGLINGRNLRMLGIEDLKKEDIRERFERFGMLILGFLDDFPIQLKLAKGEGNDLMIFVWDHFVNNRLIADNKASSFFEFLRQIQHAEKKN